MIVFCLIFYSYVIKHPPPPLLRVRNFSNPTRFSQYKFIVEENFIYERIVFFFLIPTLLNNVEINRTFTDANKLLNRTLILDKEKKTIQNATT